MAWFSRDFAVSFVDATIRSFWSIMHDRFEFRASPNNGQSDQFVHAVLPKVEWRELENGSREVINYFFVSLSNKMK